jgi:hypothetical protein
MKTCTHPADRDPERCPLRHKQDYGKVVCRFGGLCDWQGSMVMAKFAEVVRGDSIVGKGFVPLVWKHPGERRNK